MSASLVGSEMCIRDSLRGPGNACAGPTPSRPSTATGSACSARGTHTERCLLYTSDAADDM
eukprot:8166306-Alexandrium_andersonii.AAC.1